MKNLSKDLTVLVEEYHGQVWNYEHDDLNYIPQWQQRRYNKARSAGLSHYQSMLYATVNVEN